MTGIFRCDTEDCCNEKCMSKEYAASGYYDFCNYGTVGTNSTCPCEYKVNVSLPAWDGFNECTTPEGVKSCYTRYAMSAIDETVVVSNLYDDVDPPFNCPSSFRKCGYYGRNLSVATKIVSNAGADCIPAVTQTLALDLSVWIVGFTPENCTNCGGKYDPFYVGKPLLYVCGDDYAGTNSDTCSAFYVAIAIDSGTKGCTYSGGIVYRHSRGSLDCDDFSACWHDSGYSESYRVSWFTEETNNYDVCCYGQPTYFRSWGYGSGCFTYPNSPFSTCTDPTDDLVITVDRP